MKRQTTLMITFHAVLMVAAASFISSCNGGSGTPPPVPQIQNINSSTTPTSPVGLPVEINGSGYQAAPGKVNFKQGSLFAVQVEAKWSRLAEARSRFRYVLYLFAVKAMPCESCGADLAMSI